MLTASLCLFQFDPEPERQTKRITKSMQEEFQHLSTTPPILDRKFSFLHPDESHNCFCFQEGKQRLKMNVPDHFSLTWSSVEPKACLQTAKKAWTSRKGLIEICH